MYINLSVNRQLTVILTVNQEDNINGSHKK